MAIPWGPPLGQLLGRVFTDGSHHKLVDLLCDRAYEWVRDNNDTVQRVVATAHPAGRRSSSTGCSRTRSTPRC